MTELIKMQDGKAIVSSKDIADKFGKIHRDVMKGIKVLNCSDDFRVRNFSQSVYTSDQNKKLPCYNITRDGFVFLCMGFTGARAADWKEAYISAFNEMESALREAPATMAGINQLVKTIESNKEIASIHGRELARYRKVKIEQEIKFNNAVNQAQQSLGFK